MRNINEINEIKTFFTISALSYAADKSELLKYRTMAVETGISIQEQSDSASESITAALEAALSDIASAEAKAIRKNKDMEASGKADLSLLLDEKLNADKEKPLYLFETDKILDEEYKSNLGGIAYGY